jgi:hypothetical protein
MAVDLLGEEQQRVEHAQGRAEEPRLTRRE